MSQSVTAILGLFFRKRSISLYQEFGGWLPFRVANAGLKPGATMASTGGIYQQSYDVL